MRVAILEDRTTDILFFSSQREKPDQTFTGRLRYRAHDELSNPGSSISFFLRAPRYPTAYSLVSPRALNNVDLCSSHILQYNTDLQEYWSRLRTLDNS